jgi:hypothetical protein
MNRKDVDVFEKLAGQLEGVYDELSVLSKKSPNDAVNKFKLKFVNSLLSESNSYLSEAYRPFADFEVFDLDEMPQNSDVVFILAQYLQCFEKLRADNVVVKNGGWNWSLVGEKGDAVDERGRIYIRTVSPKKLRV